MVKISIVMPVYNSQNHLKDTLNCIINQTFTDFELICVNDGSSDNSLDILNECSLNDSRVKVISQENGGPGAARNNGLKHCRGEYIYFMDSDDYIIPEFLQLVYNNMTNNDSEIVMFNNGNIENDYKNNVDSFFPFDEVFTNVDFNNFTFDYHCVRKYVLNAAFAPWSKFYKKDLFDRYDDFTFNEDLPYEDVLFHIKAMLRALRISFVPQYLYYYRIDNPNSDSLKCESHIKIFNVIDDVEAFLDKENYLKDFDKEFEYFKVGQIISHMIPPISDEYFRLAKSHLSETDLDKNDLVHRNLKKKYLIFHDSDNAFEYEKRIERYLLLEDENKLLKKENDKLTKELELIKNNNEELLSSHSWRLTKPLRMFFQLFRK